MAKSVFKNNMQAALNKAKAGGSTRLPKAQFNIPGSTSAPGRPMGPFDHSVPTGMSDQNVRSAPRPGPGGEPIPPFVNQSGPGGPGGQGMSQGTSPMQGMGPEQLIMIAQQMAATMSMDLLRMKFDQMFPPGDPSAPQNNMTYVHFAQIANNMLGPGQPFIWKGDQYMTGVDPNALQQ